MFHRKLNILTLIRVVFLPRQSLDCLKSIGWLQISFCTTKGKECTCSVFASNKPPSQKIEWVLNLWIGYELTSARNKSELVAEKKGVFAWSNRQSKPFFDSSALLVFKVWILEFCQLSLCTLSRPSFPWSTTSSNYILSTNDCKFLWYSYRLILLYRQ